MVLCVPLDPTKLPFTARWGASAFRRRPMGHRERIIEVHELNVQVNGSSRKK